MSYRGRIHKNKKDDFIRWLISDGWVILPTKSIYEEIRATKKGKIIIYYIRDKSDHLSSSDGRESSIAENYLRSRRKEGGGKERGGF